ncbi:MAG: acetylxylan esterase, partial [Planctomycetota bacterium]
RRLELEKVKPNFKVTKSDRSTEDVEVYLVEMRSHGNVLIRSWYTVPKKPGPHATILSVPGYNSTMRPYVNRKNVATFALNPRGHGNSKDDVDPKGGEYMYLGFDPEHPEKYVYVGAYMDCVRAVDFLTSRPEIDKSRIGVEGSSQGGGLSFATAALDRRIAFCAPDIPWLGDWVGYLAASDWPNEHYPELIERFPALTFSDINRILSYVDTMNLADRIKCPVLMSVGLQDSVCPPRNSFATYNQVRSRKEYRVYPFSGHGVGHKHNNIKNEWIAAILGVEQL